MKKPEKDPLVFDIEMSLQKIPRGLFRRMDDRQYGHLDREAIATKILAHLKLAGWTFERPDRSGLHRTPEVRK